MDGTKVRITLAAIALMSMTVGSSGEAASAAMNCYPAPDRVLRFGPTPSNRAIQNFDYGPGDEVYFVQRSGSTTRLSRCSRTDEETCVLRDSAKLKGFGHGESLEVFSDKGRTYAWVGSGANRKSQSHHSKRVSLIEYLKAPKGSKRASYRKLGTLTDLASLIPGKSGSPIRSAVAVADGRNRLALRVQIKGRSPVAFYGVYEADKLTKLLLRAPGKKLSIAKAQDALLSEFSVTGSPHESFQGFDIMSTSPSRMFLYVFGGKTGQDPTVFRYSMGGEGRVERDRTYVLSGRGIGGMEAEGIKVESDPTKDGELLVRFGLKPAERDRGGRRIFRLYRFSEKDPRPKSKDLRSRPVVVLGGLSRMAVTTFKPRHVTCSKRSAIRP